MQIRLEPQLFFVRKDSRGPEATTDGPGYYTVAATFVLYMDVTSTQSVILLDKQEIIGFYFL